MKKKTLAALQASIKHWLHNSKAEQPKEASDASLDCPLCVEFDFPYSNCEGCPVSKRAGRWACRDTPYSKASAAFRLWKHNPDDPDLKQAFQSAATDEYEFLKGLLPK